MSIVSVFMSWLVYFMQLYMQGRWDHRGVFSIFLAWGFSVFLVSIYLLNYRYLKKKQVLSANKRDFWLGMIPSLIALANTILTAVLCFSI